MPEMDDLAACAGIVQRGDPDRFLSVMAAPPAARPALFAIYALNVEASRAPWITAEPLIAEMRLQWWRDALEEIATGAAPRRHEVVTPLSQIIDAEGARLLDAVVAARRWEIAREPLGSEAALLAHLGALGGGLMWAAARALGAEDEEAVRRVGQAGAIAGWLSSVPDFTAHGVQALPDDSDAAIAGLARQGLALLGPVSRAARPAALAAWEARPVLSLAAKDPERVRAGDLRRPEGLRRLRLMRLAVTGPR